MAKTPRELKRLRVARAAAEAAALEAAATQDLELDDLRLENVKLRGQARRLEGAVLQQEIFDERARELQRLAKKETAAIKQSVQKLEDLLYEHEDAVPVTAGTCRVLRRDIADLAKNAATRRQELEALRTQRRRDAIDQISADSMALAVQRLSRETAQKEEALERERLQWAALNARAHIAGQDIDALERRRDALRADQAKAALEVEHLEFQAALVKRERDKEEVIDRFVAKHAALHHPSFLTERSSRDRATTAQLWKQISSALEALHDHRAPHGVEMVLAKLRIEASKMHTSVLDALQREETVADALFDMVQKHELASVHDSAPHPI